MLECRRGGLAGTRSQRLLAGGVTWHSRGPIMLLPPTGKRDGCEGDVDLQDCAPGEGGGRADEEARKRRQPSENMARRGTRRRKCIACTAPPELVF